MTAFFLPCDCSADVVVTAGQAGGSVECPRCGRTLSVPKLRDLGRLRRQDRGDIAPTAARHPARAVAILGTILAAASWLGGLWVASGPAPPATDDAMLRSAVLSADDLAIYKVWNEGLARAVVRRPPTAEEEVILRQARFAEGVRGVLNIVAAGAALAAAGAAVASWFAERASPGPSTVASPERARP
jgi:hypothetical protein